MFGFFSKNVKIEKVNVTLSKKSDNDLIQVINKTQDAGTRNRAKAILNARKQNEFVLYGRVS